ncbi:DUF4199 domain-containing protein [Aestuariivivens sp. NBU2969]|uniref:DUF4199 domain-containing protein n=1 Tax=Aestuariivivens sp. NBU2969 TaxID=2873267 RepID=UPI001CBB954E|nr:DUF4199 domain-containing protein [Aestuariivivens sp. NBU2969]
MEKSLKSIAKDYGLYLGVLLTLLLTIAYAIDLNLFVNTWFGLSIYAIAIIFGLISIAKVKQAFDGYTNFKEAFTAYFITSLIGSTIVTLVSFILFNFIDTDAATFLKEKSIEKVVGIYESINMHPDKISETVDKLEAENLYSIKNSLIALFVNYMLPLCVIGLLVAATMKKNNPDSQ